MTQITQINPEGLNVASQMILKEIDLRGTDAERKTKLDQFETDWKALTGASDLTGARFVGLYTGKDNLERTALFIHKFSQDTTYPSVYEGISIGADKGYGDIHKNMNDKVEVDSYDGAISITPLFSHLEPVEIFDDNSIESKKKNIDNINTYKANLEQLGVDTSISFQIPIYRKSNSGVEESGFLIYSNLPHVYKPYSGLFLNVDETSFSVFGISSTGEFIEQTYYATLEDVQQANTLAQALKDLHTPIAISTENTTESKAQNVRNIADFVAKAKAAGITDVNGMAVSCIIDDAYSGVGYIDTGTICGIEIFDDFSNPRNFKLDPDGTYGEVSILMENSDNIVTSSMLTQGARKPIILTPSTTEVDEETYQKLLIDDVDVMFKTADGNYCVLTYNEAEGVYYFTALSGEGTSLSEVYLYGYKVSINDTAPHKVTVEKLYASDIHTLIANDGLINESTIKPVPLTATISMNKTKLDLFLSKVPTAQVMHVTYKDVYAGTLHKMNGSWYGVLVGDSRTLVRQLIIELQADGTIVEGTA